jgi:hypothetical protein
MVLASFLEGEQARERQGSLEQSGTSLIQQLTPPQQDLFFGEIDTHVSRGWADSVPKGTNDAREIVRKNTTFGIVKEGKNNKVRPVNDCTGTNIRSAPATNSQLSTVEAVRLFRGNHLATKNWTWIKCEYTKWLGRYWKWDSHTGELALKRETVKIDPYHVTKRGAFEAAGAFHVVTEYLNESLALAYANTARKLSGKNNGFDRHNNSGSPHRRSSQSPREHPL